MYDPSRQNLMLKSCSTHSGRSPSKRTNKQTEAAHTYPYTPSKQPRTRTRRAIASFLEIVRINPVPVINRSTQVKRKN